MISVPLTVVFVAGVTATILGFADSVCDGWKGEWPAPTFFIGIALLCVSAVMKLSAVLVLKGLL